MPQDTDFSNLATKAEAAVEGIKDPELRRVAFQRVLDELIEATRSHRPDNVAQMPQPAPGRSPTISPASSPPRHSILPSIAVGFLIAAFVAVTQSPRFFEALSAAAEGRGTVAWLRGVESDLAVHFFGNWFIWSAIAVGVTAIWRGLRRGRKAGSPESLERGGSGAAEQALSSGKRVIQPDQAVPPAVAEKEEYKPVPAFVWVLFALVVLAVLAIPFIFGR